jgi:hypothetical protein
MDRSERGEAIGQRGALHLPQRAREVMREAGTRFSLVQAWHSMIIALRGS